VLNFSHARQSVARQGTVSATNATGNAVSETVRLVSRCAGRRSAARTTSACQGATEGPATLASWTLRCDVHVAPPRLECHVGERKPPDLLGVESLAQHHPFVTMRGELHILVIQVAALAVSSPVQKTSVVATYVWCPAMTMSPSKWKTPPSLLVHGRSGVPKF